MAPHAMMGNIEGVLWHALLYNTSDWLRNILPMSPKLAAVGSVGGLKWRHINIPGCLGRENVLMFQAFETDPDILLSIVRRLVRIR